MPKWPACPWTQLTCRLPGCCKPRCAGHDPAHFCISGGCAVLLCLLAPCTLCTAGKRMAAGDILLQVWRVSTAGRQGYRRRLEDPASHCTLGHGRRQVVRQARCACQPEAIPGLLLRGAAATKQPQHIEHWHARCLQLRFTPGCRPAGEQLQCAIVRAFSLADQGGIWQEVNDTAQASDMCRHLPEETCTGWTHVGPLRDNSGSRPASVVRGITSSYGVAYLSAAETGSASSSCSSCSMLAASLRLLGCSDGSTTRQGRPCASGQQTGSCSAGTQEGMCSPVTGLPTQL